MTKKTCHRSWMQSQAANIIFAALGGNTRFVGGAVRDAALGIDAKDIDIATPLTPDEVTKKLEAIGVKIIPTGIKHGTVTAVTGKGNFEITTLRRDTEHTGRHATVEFTDSWQEDAARRDFTINAMFCNQAGEISDYYGGLPDLEAGILRFVGDAEQRCKEDYLRILRFFRFFAYYGRPPLDEAALLACKAQANGIEGLSGERIQTEMFKLLAAPAPVFSLELMLQNNVIGFVIPDIQKDGIAALEKLVALKDSGKNNHLLRLAALIGYNLSVAENVAKRWKLSNADKARLLFLCDAKHNIPKNCEEKSARKLLREWGYELFIDVCHLAFARGLENSEYTKLLALKNWKIPAFPLTGKDLKSIGIEEGKAMGAALKKAENWWEENDYKPSKNTLLEYISKTK